MSGCAPHVPSYYELVFLKGSAVREVVPTASVCTGQPADFMAIHHAACDLGNRQAFECLTAVETYYGATYQRYEQVFGASLILLLIAVVALLMRRALQRAGEQAIHADDRFSARTAGELVTRGLHSLVDSTLGHDGRKWLPLFGTIFIFILLNNLLGLVPGFNPPTGAISTNFGVAGVVFMLTHVVGFRTHGFAYAKHFMGPVIFLAPLLFVIEIISHLVRPVSLSVRLFGNMTGDHTVLAVFTDLTGLIIPVIFLGLGTFICFVQALVFTMLSMIYIGGAMAHDH